MSSNSPLTSRDRSKHRPVRGKRKSARCEVIRDRKISLEKRNPPRSPVDAPRRALSRWLPQKTARPRGGAILKNVLVARLTPSTRPVRGARKAQGTGERGEGGKRRRREGRASNEVAGKKVRRIKEGDKTAGDVSSFAAPASSSASLSRGRRRCVSPFSLPSHQKEGGER